MEKMVNVRVLHIRGKRYESVSEACEDFGIKYEDVEDLVGTGNMTAIDAILHLEELKKLGHTHILIAEERRRKNAKVIIIDSDSGEYKYIDTIQEAVEAYGLSKEELQSIDKSWLRRRLEIRSGDIQKLRKKKKYEEFICKNENSDDLNVDGKQFKSMQDIANNYLVNIDKLRETRCINNMNVVSAIKKLYIDKDTEVELDSDRNEFAIKVNRGIAISDIIERYRFKLSVREKEGEKKREDLEKIEKEKRAIRKQELKELKFRYMTKHFNGVEYNTKEEYGKLAYRWGIDVDELINIKDKTGDLEKAVCILVRRDELSDAGADTVGYMKEAISNPDIQKTVEKYKKESSHSRLIEMGLDIELYEEYIEKGLEPDDAYELCLIRKKKVKQLKH